MMGETALKMIAHIDDNLIRDIRDRIVEAVKPERIILFGSYAYGKQSDRSDLDILIIMDSDIPRYKRSVVIYRALGGLLIPKDVFVYTQEEVAEWSEVPQAFITTIMKKGKVIYEKEQS